MLRRLSFLLSLYIISFCGMAQDPNWSQFYSNQIYMNPAYTGLNKGLRLGLNYRNQWPTVPGKINTFTFEGDIQDFNLGGGIGINAMSDYEGEGALKTTSIGALYSYRLVVVSRAFDIQAGFGFNYVMKSIDWSKFVFSDQLDPVQGNIYQSAASPSGTGQRNFVDLDAGALAKFQMKLGDATFANTLGVGVHHLTQPNESLLGLQTRLPMRITVHYNSLIPLGGSINFKNTFISPNIIWEQQGNFQTITLGFYILKSPIFAGLWYRDKTPLLTGSLSDAMIANIGWRSSFDGGMILQVGYSYDLTVSHLATSTGGTHEFSVILQFDKAKLTHTNTLSGSRKSNNCFQFGNGGFLGL